MVVVLYKIVKRQPKKFNIPQRHLLCDIKLATALVLGFCILPGKAYFLMRFLVELEEVFQSGVMPAYKYLQVVLPVINYQKKLLLLM